MARYAEAPIPVDTENCDENDAHYAMHLRGNLLLSMHGDWISWDDPGTELYSEYRDDTSQTVMFEIRSHFVPTFAGFFESIPLVTRVIGPYMLASNAGQTGCSKACQDKLTGLSGGGGDDG